MKFILIPLFLALAAWAGLLALISPTARFECLVLGTMLLASAVAVWRSDEL